jgi:hypothetical protein
LLALRAPFASISITLSRHLCPHFLLIAAVSSAVDADHRQLFKW